MSRKVEGRETFTKIETFMKSEYSFFRRMDKGKDSSRYGGPQRRYSLGTVPEGKKWTRSNTPRLYITLNYDDIEVEAVLKKELEVEIVQTRFYEGVGITLSTGLRVVGRFSKGNNETHLHQYKFKLDKESLHQPHAVALITFIIQNGCM
jgi:hypothetical protein